eukprot:TRINITY_DN102141_c0_g1_i1.p1 TRINITY_DN102141_c0_g1~~TRINITY_DN102141_c0_g1_i1.p1  ORF type:complete len:502 (-),score=165.33 TRINITY_DN102141_c0_g1_i1:42-1547(-)
MADAETAAESTAVADAEAQPPAEAPTGDKMAVDTPCVEQPGAAAADDKPVVETPAEEQAGEKKSEAEAAEDKPAGEEPGKEEKPASESAAPAAESSAEAKAGDEKGAAPGGEDAAATGSAPALKGTLSERLQNKGVEIDGPGAKHVPLTAESLALNAAVAPAHTTLAVTASEQKELFTPLADQGAAAIEAEKKRREHTEAELLKGVIGTIKRWVQECLASDEKKDQLLKKGSLKCKVQARWSEGLHTKLKEYVEKYGGKLHAASDQDGADKGPAWANAATVRDEKWLIAFDAAAFQAFMTKHPEIVEPPEDKVRSFVKDFVSGADLNNMSMRQVMDAMTKKFGKLRPTLMARVKCMVTEEVVIITTKTTDKRKKDEKDGGPAAKKMKTGAAVRIERPEDVTWAEAALVPFGLKAESDQPVVRAPAEVALPILEGLRSFQNMEDFRSLLKTTKIGKVINSFRHHPDGAVAKTSKELLMCWKAAIALKKPGARVGAADTAAKS